MRTRQSEDVLMLAILCRRNNRGVTLFATVTKRATSILIYINIRKLCHMWIEMGNIQYFIWWEIIYKNYSNKGWYDMIKFQVIAMNICFLKIFLLICCCSMINIHVPPLPGKLRRLKRFSRSRVQSLIICVYVFLYEVDWSDGVMIYPRWRTRTHTHTRDSQPLMTCTPLRSEII